MQEPNSATQILDGQSAVESASQLNLTQKINHTIDAFRHGNLTQGASEMLQSIVVPASMGLLSLLAVYFISKLISGRVASVICKRVDETLGKFVGKLLYWTVMVIASVMVLSYVGLPVSGFMAVLATAGFAIGLAFQGTLSNFSAGILLLVFRPFKVGDTVNIANVLGKINEIDIFTTTLDTPDNRRLIIPNASIASGTIENISYHPHRRVEVVVGVEYGANLETTRAALLEAVSLISDMVIPGENRGHQIMLTNLGSSSVDWTVRIWVAKEDFVGAKERLTCQIKASLMAHHISIPFPQLHLHMSPAAQQSLNSEQRVDPPTLAMPTIHSNSTAKVRPRLRGESVVDHQ